MTAKPRPERPPKPAPEPDPTPEEEEARMQRLYARGLARPPLEPGGMTPEFLEELDRIAPAPPDPTGSVRRALLEDRAGGP